MEQICQLTEAGCQIVRMAVYDQEDARAIREIKAQVSVPLVADIHFDYKLALTAIESGVDKIRINPGNIGARENVVAVVNACKQHQVPIRIGINSGSLEKAVLEKYGRPCAEAMIESARKHVEILEELDFHDICLSFKSSDVMLTIEAYRLASEVFPSSAALRRDRSRDLYVQRDQVQRSAGRASDGWLGRHHPCFRQRGSGGGTAYLQAAAALFQSD